MTKPEIAPGQKVNGAGSVLPRQTRTRMRLSPARTGAAHTKEFSHLWRDRRLHLFTATVEARNQAHDVDNSETEKDIKDRNFKVGPVKG